MYLQFAEVLLSTQKINWVWKSQKMFGLQIANLQINTFAEVLLI
jgi:hypothetical protein